MSCVKNNYLYKFNINLLQNTDNNANNSFIISYIPIQSSFYNLYINYIYHFTADLDMGAIIGIAVACLLVIVIVGLIVAARATGRWCFAGNLDYIY